MQRLQAFLELHNGVVPRVHLRQHGARRALRRRRGALRAQRCRKHALARITRRITRQRRKLLLSRRFSYDGLVPASYDSHVVGLQRGAQLGEVTHRVAKADL